MQKTAEWVRKKGTAFETMIRTKESGNAKFSFLNEGDVFHETFRKLVNGESILPAEEDPVPIATETVEEEKDTFWKDIFIRCPSIPSQTPSFGFSLALPDDLTIQEYERIRTTAAFSVWFGTPFVEALRNAERNTPMFEFLSPPHPHFDVFTKWKKQFSYLLRNGKKIMEELEKESSLDSWNTFASSLSIPLPSPTKPSLTSEPIDWSHFTVVERLHFSNESDVPTQKPLSPSRVGFVQIYQPPIRSMKMLECPICHDMIPSDMLDDHMKSELRNTDVHEELKKRKREEKKAANVSDADLAEHFVQTFDAPLAKKKKSMTVPSMNRSIRVSEEEWKKKYPGSISIWITWQNASWEESIYLSETIGEALERWISSNSLLESKLKVKWQQGGRGISLKEKDTFAKWNIGPGDVLVLAKKRRGGR